MQVILADHQAIFLEGVASILKAERTIHVAAQCSNLKQLWETMPGLHGSIVIFAPEIADDTHLLLDWTERWDSRSVMILERGAVLDGALAARLDGVILRTVAGPQLVDCLHRVDAGERSLQHAVTQTLPLQDRAGARAVHRLTPRELQIVALITEGCRNKEIATQLGTNEQVIKNHLRNIYGKTGVSDRLELAVFTARHQAFAEVVQAARLAMELAAYD